MENDPTKEMYDEKEKSESREKIGFHEFGIIFIYREASRRMIVMIIL